VDPADRGFGLVIFAVGALVIANDPPTGIVTIDPLWWSLLEAFMVVATLAVISLEIRQHLRSRRPA
jgi:hypothetical protein